MRFVTKVMAAVVLVPVVLTQTPATALLGTVKDTLEALLPAIREKKESNHLSDALAHYKKARRDLDALAETILS